jgi:hypothetical protein
MFICWDNIENLTFTKKGRLRDKKNKITYFIKECDICGDSFITYNKKTKGCTKKCSKLLLKNSLTGKKLSEEIKNKIRKGCSGEKSPWFGKKLTEQHKEKIREKNKDKYFSNNIPKYDIYTHQIEWCEPVRRNKEDSNILEVKCAYCGKWYIPTYFSIRSRINCINGNPNYRGEQRLYCSDSCKEECPIYGKTSETLMKEDAVRAGRLNWIELNREVQPELRQMVFKRDDYKCVKCGSNENLHCHHIEGIRWEPLESADIDKCITLCKNCHKAIHMKEDCRYNDLKCK